MNRIKALFIPHKVNHLVTAAKKLHQTSKWSQWARSSWISISAPKALENTSTSLQRYDWWRHACTNVWVCRYCHWYEDKNLENIIYLQEGGVGWVQLGVALNLEDKNSCLQGKLPEHCSSANRTKSSQMLEPLIACVRCVWRLDQLMETWVTPMLQCAAKMSHSSSPVALQHTHTRTCTPASNVLHSISACLIFIQDKYKSFPNINQMQI